MSKTDIGNREDVARLVRLFYAKVRRDPDIGAFFNQSISDWPEHLEKLTDFWETNLFFVSKYKGNPIVAHQEVHKKTGFKINDYHFGIWLRLWMQTIDENFFGQVADKAKNRARNIATRLFISLYEYRLAQTS